jgi:putative polyhydroxyalkanoate system protein
MGAPAAHLHGNAVASIAVTRPYVGEPRKIRDALEALARELQTELGGAYAWDGDRLRFTAPGARGTIQVGDREVTVEVDLGLLLRPLRGRIEDEIRRRLETTLA